MSDGDIYQHRCGNCDRSIGRHSTKEDATAAFQTHLRACVMITPTFKLVVDEDRFPDWFKSHWAEADESVHQHYGIEEWDYTELDDKLAYFIGPHESLVRFVTDLEAGTLWRPERVKVEPHNYPVPFILKPFPYDSAALLEANPPSPGVAVQLLNNYLKDYQAVGRVSLETLRMYSEAAKKATSPQMAAAEAYTAHLKSCNDAYDQLESEAKAAVALPAWKWGYCQTCQCELSPAMDGEGATKCRGHQ